MGYEQGRLVVARACFNSMCHSLIYGLGSSEVVGLTRVGWSRPVNRPCEHGWGRRQVCACPVADVAGTSARRDILAARAHYSGPRSESGVRTCDPEP